MKASELLKEIRTHHYQNGVPNYAAIVPLIRQEKSALKDFEHLIEDIDEAVKKVERQDDSLDGNVIFEIETIVGGATVFISLKSKGENYLRAKEIQPRAKTFSSRRRLQTLMDQYHTLLKEDHAYIELLHLYNFAITETNPILYLLSKTLNE